MRDQGKPRQTVGNLQARPAPSGMTYTNPYPQTNNETLSYANVAGGHANKPKHASGESDQSLVAQIQSMMQLMQAQFAQMTQMMSAIIASLCK